jgi:hypothetical protein
MTDLFVWVDQGIATAMNRTPASQNEVMAKKRQRLLDVVEGMSIKKKASYPKLARLAREEFGEQPPDLPKTVVALTEWMMEQLNELE